MTFGINLGNNYLENIFIRMTFNYIYNVYHFKQQKYKIPDLRHPTFVVLKI